MTYQSHSRFPLKKCLIATVVILIVASMVLVLLLSISKSVGSDTVGKILLIVLLSVTGAGVAAYWLYQTIHYIEKRKDEN